MLFSICRVWKIQSWILALVVDRLVVLIYWKVLPRFIMLKWFYSFNFGFSQTHLSLCVITYNNFKQNYLGSGHQDIVIALFPNKLVSILRNFTLNSNFLKFPSLSNLVPYAHYIRKMCGFGFLYSGTRLTFAFCCKGNFVVL